MQHQKTHLYCILPPPPFFQDAGAELKEGEEEEENVFPIIPLPPVFGRSTGRWDGVIIRPFSVLSRVPPLLLYFPRHVSQTGKNTEGGWLCLSDEYGLPPIPHFLFIISQGTKLGYLTSLERNGEKNKIREVFKTFYVVVLDVFFWLRNMQDSADHMTTIMGTPRLFTLRCFQSCSLRQVAAAVLVAVAAAASP